MEFVLAYPIVDQEGPDTEAHLVLAARDGSRFSLSGYVDQQGYSNASIQQVVASADSVELQIDLNDACNAANVRHTVDETAQEIRILVDVLNPSTVESCGYTEVVSLSEPLGTRIVVDESTGMEVPISDRF